jgi:ABC-type glutathione transport system ATPase component
VTIRFGCGQVLLVGDSGVGKTGLARYLADGIKDKGDNTSTDGAWATHLKLPHATTRT